MKRIIGLIMVVVVTMTFFVTSSASAGFVPGGTDAYSSGGEPKIGGFTGFDITKGTLKKVIWKITITANDVTGVVHDQNNTDDPSEFTITHLYVSASWKITGAIPGIIGGPISMPLFDVHLVDESSPLTLLNLPSPNSLYVPYETAIVVDKAYEITDKSILAEYYSGVTPVYNFEDSMVEIGAGGTYTGGSTENSDVSFGGSARWNVNVELQYEYEEGPPVVPEPATIALLGLGLLGLPFVHRLRRK